MRNRANRSLPAHSWLPQLMAMVLVAAPVFAQQPPATTAPNPQARPPAATPMAPLPMVHDLKVIALAGSGEMNDLERGTMAPLVVQVLDQNDRPVEGAEVVFRFPLDGPSATFRGGNTSLTVRTNGQGQAAAVNWTANKQVGTFTVRVTASYGNELGEMTIPMTNVTRIVESERLRHKHTSWYSSKWFKIALIAGGAGIAAGVILGTRGGGTPASSTITITPGSPSVGGPH